MSQLARFLETALALKKLNYKDFTWVRFKGTNAIKLVSKGKPFKLEPNEVFGYSTKKDKDDNVKLFVPRYSLSSPVILSETKVQTLVRRSTAFKGRIQDTINAASQSQDLGQREEQKEKAPKGKPKVKEKVKSKKPVDVSDDISAEADKLVKEIKMPSGTTDGNAPKGKKGNKPVKEVKKPKKVKPPPSHEPKFKVKVVKQKKEPKDKSQIAPGSVVLIRGEGEALVTKRYVDSPYKIFDMVILRSKKLHTVSVPENIPDKSALMFLRKATKKDTQAVAFSELSRMVSPGDIIVVDTYQQQNKVSNTVVASDVLPEENVVLVYDGASLRSMSLACVVDVVHKGNGKFDPADSAYAHVFKGART